jgi:hypothetical protein
MPEVESKVQFICTEKNWIVEIFFNSVLKSHHQHQKEQKTIKTPQ